MKKLWKVHEVLSYLIIPMVARSPNHSMTVHLVIEIECTSTVLLSQIIREYWNWTHHKVWQGRLLW